MSIRFNWAVLEFQAWGKQVALNCEWAKEVRGGAICRWSDASISVTYCAFSCGQIKVETASSEDNHIGIPGSVDQVALTPNEGDNLDVLDQLIKNKSIPVSDLCVGICIVSAQKISKETMQALAVRYTECLNRLGGFHPEHLQGALGGVVVFTRNILIEESLFRSWCSERGRPPGWMAETEAVLISSNATRDECELILDICAYSFVNHVVRRLVDSESEPFVPLSLRGRDPWQLLLRLSQSAKILISPEICKFLIDLGNLVEDVQRLSLPCAHLSDLYSFVGPKWLEKESAKAACIRGIKDAALSSTNPIVIGWQALRKDTIVEHAQSSNLLIHTWGALSVLAWSLGISREQKGFGADTTRHRLRDKKEYPKVAFEMLVCAALVKLGMSVEFVPLAQKRMPDICMAAPNGESVFVECSAKDVMSADSHRSLNIAKSVASQVLKRHGNLRRSFICEILFSLAPGSHSQKNVMDALERAYGTSEEITPEFNLRVLPLGDWQDVYDWRSLMKRASDACDHVFLSGTRRGEWGGELMTNANLVGIGVRRDRDLLKSIIATIRDKGKWQSRGGQIPNGRPGIIALHLGDCRRETVRRLYSDLEQKVSRDFRSVSVVLLFWVEREEESHRTARVRILCAPISNQAAYSPIPSGIRVPAGTILAFGSNFQSFDETEIEIIAGGLG